MEAAAWQHCVHSPLSRAPDTSDTLTLNKRTWKSYFPPENEKAIFICKFNLFERNRNGETALNICQTLKNPEGVKCLEQYQVEYDKSRTQAEELLEELYKEEEHDEEARARRRQKKWRNKINKIAKAENITAEEVEERLQKEEERKKQEEAQKKREELQREQ